jgi:AcrR family transcriptional regulator
MERKRLDHKKVPSGAAVMRPMLTDALFRAFFEEWASRGFAALSLEAVAKRAGAGKAALYRRWPSKIAMAREALNLVAVDLTATPHHDTLIDDVSALLLAVRRALRHPLIRRIVPDLNAELARSPAFADAMQPLQEARRARGEALLRLAVARGELSADLDIDLANDLLVAALYWRMAVVPGPTDRAYLDRLVTTVVAGLRSMS